MTGQRNPEEIVLALNSRRDRIKTDLQLHAPASSANLPIGGAANTPLLQSLGAIQQYLLAYAQAYLTPATMLQFAVRRPVLVGVGVAVVILAGPSRLVGWVAKASAFWRLVSVISSRR